MDSPVVWLLILFTGLAVAVTASRWAVDHLVSFAATTRIPPFLIGITLVAVGTDLPEIANSVVASAAGHGDVNVGDSIGSALAQTTLVLGLLPFIAGSFEVARHRVARIGAACVAALLLGAVLIADGRVGRIEALLLLTCWVAGTVLVSRELPEGGQPAPVPVEDRRVRHLLLAVGGLVLVGIGAVTAVQAMIRIAELMSAPEYLVAFLVGSIGTSLPELTVTVAAVRRGQWDLAVGDALGSSFADATLSVAAGPLLFPISVTAGIAVLASVVGAAAIGFAVLILSMRGVHDRRSGSALLAMYAVSYFIVIAIG